MAIGSDNDFPALADFVLNQILGYQDVNDMKSRSARLRDAFNRAHAWNDNAVGNVAWDASAESHASTVDLGQHSGNIGVAAGAGKTVYFGDGGNLTNLTVATADLKTAVNEVSSIVVYPNYESLTLTNSGYGFWPRLRTTDVTFAAFGRWGGGTWSTAYQEILALATEHGSTRVYGHRRYIQTSPPYALGRIPDWGEFVFFRRKKSDGTVISSWCAPDPVWAGSWSPLPKGHPERMTMFPHPFANFYNKPIPSSEEIVLIDLRELNAEIKYNPEQERLNAMRDIRNDLGAQGISTAELHRFEAEQEAVVNAALPIHVQRIDMLKHKYEMSGKSFLQAINEGLVSEAIAEFELSPPERAKLPKILTFSDNVRVLRRK